MFVGVRSANPAKWLGQDVVVVQDVLLLLSMRTFTIFVGTPPTLLKLMNMKGADGKPLNVIKTITASNYKTFGIHLLQDANGARVDLIKKNQISDGAENITLAILQKWLESDAPTRTYQHLIECLRKSGLHALAELIANATEMRRYSNIQ